MHSNNTTDTLVNANPHLPAVPNGFIRKNESYNGEDYVSVGWFSPNAPRQELETAGIASLIFDFDAADWFVWTKVSATTPKIQEFTSKAAAKDAKGYLQNLGDQPLGVLLDEQLSLINKVLGALDLKPTYCIRSGYGHHVHIWLDRTAETREDQLQVKKLGEDIKEQINTSLGFYMADRAVCSIGSQICRPMVGFNNKNQNKPRALIAVSSNVDFRLSLYADIKAIDQELFAEERAKVEELKKLYKSDDIDQANQPKKQTKTVHITKSAKTPKSKPNKATHHIPASTLINGQRFDSYSHLDYSTRIPCKCPIHVDGNASAFVAAYNGKPYIHCSVCGGIHVETDPVADNSFDFAVLTNNNPRIHVEKINSRYCDPVFVVDAINKHLPNGEGIVYLVSGTGTGKTEVIRSLSTLKGQNKDASQISLAPRVSLVEDQLRRFDPTAGWTSYQSNPSAKKVVSTVDSCLKVPVLDSNFGERDIALLIMDEYDQVLDTAVGGTVQTKAPQIVAKLTTLINQSKLTICSGADIDQDHVEATKNILGIDKDVLIIVNKYKNQGNIRLFRSKDGLEIHLINQLSNGKRVFVTHEGGPKQVQGLERLIAKKLPLIKVQSISSDNSKATEQKAFLSDIQASLAMNNIDCLISTQSLGTGVDINGHFDEIVAFAPVHDIDARHVLQHVARERSPKDQTISLWIEHKRLKRETDADKLYANLCDSRNWTKKALTKVYGASLPVVLSASALVERPIDEVSARLWCALIGKRDKSVNQLDKSIIELAKAKGYCVLAHQVGPNDESALIEALDRAKADELAAIKASTEPKADPKVKDAARLKREAYAALKKARKAIEAHRDEASEALEEAEDAHAQAIVSARDVDQDEAEAVRRAYSASQADIQASTKQSIAAYYEKPVTTDLVKLDNRGKFRKKLNRFAVLYLTQEGETKEAMHKDLIRYSTGCLHAKTESFIASHYLIKNILPLYGVGGKLQDHKDELIPCADFQKIIKPMVPSIKHLFGVSAVPLIDPSTKYILADIDPMRLLGDILGRYGIELDSVRKQVKGKRTRTYKLSNIDQLLDLAQAPIARMRAVELAPKPVHNPVQVDVEALNKAFEDMCKEFDTPKEAKPTPVKLTVVPSAPKEEVKVDRWIDRLGFAEGDTTVTQSHT